MDVETVEEVAPGVALVTDYELIGVREPAADAKTEQWIEQRRSITPWVPVREDGVPDRPRSG